MLQTFHHYYFKNKTNQVLAHTTFLSLLKKLNVMEDLMLTWHL